jgi:hypothetical protein
MSERLPKRNIVTRRVGKKWSAAELRRLRKLYPRMRTRDIKIVGRTPGQIHSQAANLHLRKSAAFNASTEARKVWTAKDIAVLRKRYPDTPTKALAAEMRRSVSGVYGMAGILGLGKSEQYLASPAACRLRRGDNVGAAHRFQQGHVPADKGLRRPGWAPGRMAETQFKKGHFPANRDPDFYVPGALRVNADGYIDMRISFAPGALGWRMLHLILWEDVHGPISNGWCLRFKDGDRLNVEIDNLKLITRADNMRHNSIHNLPAPLRNTIQVLGQLNRRIREKQDRGSARSLVRDAGRTAG